MYDYLSFDEKGTAYFSDKGLKAFGFNMNLGTKGISDSIWDASEAHM